MVIVIDSAGARAAMEVELERYARDYRIEVAATGDEALARLSELLAADEDVAMVLADLALQPVDGVGVLTGVRAIAPTTKRVLLLDWGLQPEQMLVVSRAVAMGLVDTFLTKPTGARDEEFHGAITDDLGEWAWTTSPTVAAVRVVGDDASTLRVGDICDRLERLGVPTAVHLPESTAGRAILGAVEPAAERPIVEIMGQTVLANPTDRQLAAAFGATAEVRDVVFDLVVVGAGPAGLGAGVAAASEGLSTLIVEAEAFGGQAGTSSMIRNYLGFPRGITGRQLGRRALIQAVQFGAAFDLCRAVVGLEPGEPHHLELSDGESTAARAVLLACGVTYRRLGVPTLEALGGAGVFYGAATSHARELAGTQVVVVGAGNSGGQAALHLARYAAQVTIVARGADLASTMSTYLVREIDSDQRIGVRLDTEVVDGGGTGHLEWLELVHRVSGGRTRIAASGLFILIGTETRTAWLPDSIQRDDHGFVLTGTDLAPAGWRLARPAYPLETSVPGVFAAGDVRANGVKRVAAAAGEGAVSVPMVHRYLTER